MKLLITIIATIFINLISIGNVLACDGISESCQPTDSIEARWAYGSIVGGGTWPRTIENYRFLTKEEAIDSGCEHMRTVYFATPEHGWVEEYCGINGHWPNPTYQYTWQTEAKFTSEPLGNVSQHSNLNAVRYDFTIKVCEDPLYPYPQDSNDDGSIDICLMNPPICNCTENLLDNQCVARSEEYDKDTTAEKDGLEYYLSDANNQGLNCAILAPPSSCGAEGNNTPMPWVENPINCASGTKRQTERDYSSSVGGLSFARTYSSTAPVATTHERLYAQAGEALPSDVQVIDFSDKDDVSYHEWHVEGLPYLNIDERFNGLNFGRLRMPSGNLTNFVQDASGGDWSSNQVRHGSLEDVSSGYQFTSQAGTVYLFDTQGRLTSKTYRNGQAHTVTYPSATTATVADSFGRSVQFVYEDIPLSITDSKRIITKFIDPANNEYRYEHDSKGYITKVIYPDDTPTDWSDNPFKQYVYDDRTETKVLTGIIDENGDQYATYAYDAKNRATSTEHAGGAIKATIDYLDGVETQQSLVRFYRDETNYREAIYHHKILNGVDKITKLEQAACVDCVVGDYDYEYDANGYLSQSSSPDGEVTQFSYNTRGLLESRTEAFGTAKARTVSTTWHASFKLPLTIDEPQRLTTNIYDANGNLLSRSVKDKATNETRTITYTYNSLGQVLTVNGARTDVSDITSYEYDASGNLTKVTNALNHVTNITSHDAHGKPLSITDPNGTVTSLTYHPRGWLTSITTDGNSTVYEYDNAGLLTKVTMPNGIVLNYEYDAAHRLTAIVDAQNNRIEYSLDNYGNRTRTDIKDSSGTIKSFATQVYNDLGQIKQALGANSQVDMWDYDAEGKATQSLDALNNPTAQHYDELDRLQKVVDPNLGETQFDYDTQDRLTSVTDATNKATTYSYNAFGDLLSQTSPDTGASSFTYDSAGNLKTSLDARGVNVNYSYDALNRVISIDYPGTIEDITFSYDSIANSNKGIGRLTNITDESGSTSFVYDAKGQLTQETRVINNLSFVTGYQYDAAGLLTQMTYPSTRTVDYSRNNLGQVTQVSTTANGQTQVLANNISYLPFGPMKSLTYGNGKVLTQSFDADYRLTSKSIPGVTDLSYGYTTRNNINAITNALDAAENQSYQYDALARLTDATGDYGIQNYTFDEIGNRLSKTQDSVTESYNYSVTNHQLQSAGATSMSYDAVGNTLTKGELTFTYNQVGRLATASKTGMSANYLYNAQGQRVSKTVDGISTLYHYNQAGQLIALTDAQGSVIQEYLYLDGMRLATVSQVNLQTLILDEEQTSLSGSWAAKTHNDAYQSDAQVAIKLRNNGNNPASATWSTNLQEGTYEVYAQWFTNNKHATNAPYAINHANGTDTVNANQKSNGGSWQLLGAYSFNGASSVTLSNDADGKVVADAIRFVQISAPQKIYYSHTDHLGSPIALTDQTGAVQWKGSYDPYGKVTVEIDNLSQELRFPGQIYDAETGMHQNYFRDYDIETGRYLQSDPIGLGGGINTYGYVRANPVNRYDLKGLTDNDYITATELLHDVSNNGQHFEVPRFNYIKDPLWDLLGVLGETKYSWQAKDKDRVKINSKYWDRCITDKEAKKILEVMIHETLHYNQSTMEQIKGRFFQDDQIYGSGNGAGNLQHDSLYNKAKFYTDYLFPEYNRRRMKEYLENKEFYDSVYDNCGCDNE